MPEGNMPPKRQRASAGGSRKKRVIGNYCAVPSCSNYAGKTKGMGISYFKFPSDPTLQNLWVQRIQRVGLWNPDKSCICSTHFKDEDFLRDFKAELMGLRKRKILKPGVVPTLNLPNSLEEEDSQSGYASTANEDESKSTVSPLPKDFIVFEVGSSGEDSSGAAADCSDETNDSQMDDVTIEELPNKPEEEQKSLETSSPTEDNQHEETINSFGRPGTENGPKGTALSFPGCVQSEHLKAEISKLRMELKARDDSLFILEQSSTLKAKQQSRIIRELTEENNRLKTQLNEEREKISYLEEALATDTKLKAIFPPDELKDFLKKAKKWIEM